MHSVPFAPCCRYDPDTRIIDDIGTPQERIQFLQECAQTLFVTARIKLNIKRLYAADGRAVKELLKLANLLHRASLQAQVAPEVRTDATLCMILWRALMNGLYECSFADADCFRHDDTSGIVCRIWHAAQTMH